MINILVPIFTLFVGIIIGISIVVGYVGGLKNKK